MSCWKESGERTPWMGGMGDGVFSGDGGSGCSLPCVIMPQSFSGEDPHPNPLPEYRAREQRRYLFQNFPPYWARSPSCSSIRISWLYLATRSDRAGAPVLIWPQLVATAMSAMVASSVSPLR